MFDLCRYGWYKFAVEEELAAYNKEHPSEAQVATISPYDIAIEQCNPSTRCVNGCTPGIPQCGGDVLDWHQGYGGYGTLGPFVLGLALGPLAEALGAPGGITWSAVGVLWIYYTQYILYERVNELYAAAGKEEPLTVW